MKFSHTLLVASVVSSLTFSSVFSQKPATSPNPNPAPAVDPFGPTPPKASADPFGAGAAPADPFGAPSADPFGAGAAPADPFGAPSADPFGAGAAPADPFGGGAAPAADPNRRLRPLRRDFPKRPSDYRRIAPFVTAGQPGDDAFTRSAAAEAKIRAALDKPFPTTLIETPLNDVVQLISETYQLNCGIDTIELDHAGISSERRISFHGKRVSLRSALNLMLKESDLSWVIRDDSLLITTAEEAAAHVDVRVYAVDDLLFDSGNRFDPPSRSSGLEEAIKMIVPYSSWSFNGGNGTIQPCDLDGKYTLVIAQTEEGHRQIESLLRQLRKILKSPPK